VVRVVHDDSEDRRDEESLQNAVGGTVIYREAVRKCLL
jgi:hypothetical protein